jgi:AsmA family
MRKLLLAILFLMGLLALPLLALRSEPTLIALAYWSVETFTDLRLELKKPVLRPLQGLVSAEEIHLYPKDDSGPPFLSILEFNGDIDARDIYSRNLRETSLGAQQVILYISESDNTVDPSPFQWLEYIGWLPRQLDVGQLHLVTVKREVFVFPLKDLTGERPEPDQFVATAEAQYDGEPLSVKVQLSRYHSGDGVASLGMMGQFMAPGSGSLVRLEGVMEGTLEKFEYDFQLDGKYTDINEFTRGFAPERNLEGSLQMRASMVGNTTGFELSQARFVLDNLPEYGIEAAGSMKYRLDSGGHVELIAAGEFASMDAALEWLELDLSPLGRTQGSATLTGPLGEPVIEEFILRSISDSGLVVSASGRVDPSALQSEENIIQWDIYSPKLSALQDWTGPLPFETGSLSATGQLVGRADHINLEDLVVELGEPDGLLFRLEGTAGNITGLHPKGLAAIGNLELQLELTSPDSLHLAELLNVDLPGGFEIDGEIQLQGDGLLLRPTGGKISLKSSDIDITLSPAQGMIQPIQSPVLSDVIMDVGLSVSDTSALSQYVTRPVPVLGPATGSARLRQFDNRLELSDIQLNVNGPDLKLESRGRIHQLNPLQGVDLHNSFSGIDLNVLLMTALQDFSYANPLGELDGEFGLQFSEDKWALNGLAVATRRADGPVWLYLNASVDDFAGIPSAELEARYRLRDPGLLEALTGLPMNPTQGKLEASADSGRLQASNQATIGDSKFNTNVQLDHNKESITRLALAATSPQLYLEDLGLQMIADGKQQYKPADRLEEVEAERTLGNLLREPPRYATDIAIKVDGITGENTNIDSLDIHLTGEEKRYTLRRFNVGYANSVGEARGIIDLNANPPFVSLAGEAVAVPLSTLGRDLGTNSDVSGELTLRGGISAQGSSGPELLSQLDGSLAVALENGVFEGAAYDVLATDLLAWFYSGASRESSTRVDCAMARFELRDGIADSDSLYIETKKMVATGVAKLDLVNSQMDVTITPRSRSRSLHVPSSVRLKGDFDDPRVTVSPIAAAADAYAEVLTLVPRITLKLFGVKRPKSRKRPCEALP